MKRQIIKEEYANFLRKLLYSIENIDWSENRSAQMTKLLCYLEKRHIDWPEEIKPEREKAEKAIEEFQEGKISEFDLSRKITEIMKSLA